MTKWVAKGTYVIEKREYDGFIVCDTDSQEVTHTGGDNFEEAAHRMAQTIAAEHNRLMEVEALMPPTFYAGLSSDERVGMIVEAWRHAVEVNKQLEARVDELRSMLNASRARAGLGELE